MDCVNHTVLCDRFLPELRQGSLRRLRAQRGRRADSLRTVLDGMARFQQPFDLRHAGTPNPAAAAVLGLIPGVGAMYNGQFFKGLIHVVIFAVLVSITRIFTDLRDLHCGMDPLPVVRGLPHGQGATGRTATCPIRWG